MHHRHPPTLEGHKQHHEDMKHALCLVLAKQAQARKALVRAQMQYRQALYVGFSELDALRWATTVYLAEEDELDARRDVVRAKRREREARVEWLWAQRRQETLEVHQ